MRLWFQETTVFLIFGFVSAQFDFPSPARMIPRCVDALARIAVRVFKPAPSLKPRQKPKILAAHPYIFSVNALASQFCGHFLHATEIQLTCTQHGKTGHVVKGVCLGFP